MVKRRSYLGIVDFVNMRHEQEDQQARNRSAWRRIVSWQALITITSLSVGMLSVLLTYLTLQEPEPRVIFETISETNVLDVRRPLQDLNIVFRGQNVQEQNLNLRIVTINIANSGQVDILPSHYDHEDDWGMKFTNAEVIEARLVDANSDYLRSKVIPQRLDVDTVALPKIIFEKGAFFAIEVLLLHPKNDPPSISSIGKIAGIDKITVLTRPLARQEVSFVTKLFQGGALVQVVRAIVYLVGTWLATIAIILALIGITESFNKLNARKRRNRIQETRTIRQIDQDEVRDFLVAQYESKGAGGLKRLQELTKEPGRIEWLTPPARWITRDLNLIGDMPTTDRILGLEHRLIGSQNVLHDLTTMGMLKRGDNDDAVIDPRFSEAVDHLLAEFEG